MPIPYPRLHQSRVSSRSLPSPPVSRSQTPRILPPWPASWPGKDSRCSYTALLKHTKDVTHLVQKGTIWRVFRNFQSLINFVILPALQLLICCCHTDINIVFIVGVKQARCLMFIFCQTTLNEYYLIWCWAALYHIQVRICWYHRLSLWYQHMRTWVCESRIGCPWYMYLGHK